MGKKRQRKTFEQIVRDYLIPYREEHGHLLVPVSYTAPDGYELGKYIKEKRKDKIRGKTPEEHVRALDDLGMVWVARGVDTWAHAATAFRAGHGHLDVPQDYVTEDGIELGRRINDSRNGLRTGTLRDETRRFLDSLDPAWADTGMSREEKWCTVSGCSQPHFARGWCRKHYNNWYNHGDLDPPLKYGMVDGHGIHGKLTAGTDGGLICHECGSERQFLGRHVREHGMTADQYREAHGLGRSTSLAADALRATWSEKSSERVGSPEWRRFEEARDPDAARDESRAALQEPLRAQALQSRQEQALRASRSRGPRWCEVDGCGRKHVADGLCRTHYERRKRTGDVQEDVPVRPRKGGPRTP
jgi:hypothetical protein